MEYLGERYSALNDAQRSHLRRLVSSWVVLADFSFADLLLYVHVNAEHQQRARGIDPSAGPARLVTIAQARPATSQTLYPDDQVGNFENLSARSEVAEAFRTGEIVRIVRTSKRYPEIRVTAIPVRYEGTVIAVLGREAAQTDERIHGKLERSYSEVSGRLADMVCSGVFPSKYEDTLTEETPRVGDGALILDHERRVCYSSPNAVSALHRTGFHGEVDRRRLRELGFSRGLIADAYRRRAPAVEEIQCGESVTILARIVPLISPAGVVDGAVVLVRDVSDIRDRDRLLVSMDTTIREIHHRVKNNLQTVSSLLRLQARRVDSPEAKDAIGESVRRIASIANVHDLLSNTDSDDVRLGDVVRPILEMVQSGLVSPDIPVKFRLLGSGPMLASSPASSLSVLITELLQNAVEHGYPPGSRGGTVTVELIASGKQLSVRVSDDGIGLPDDFDLASSCGLGLTIAQTLANHELDGLLSIESLNPGPGTLAQVDVRLT